MSLQDGIVPLEWKEANIIPLFKKCSRNKSINDRPVSLTSIIYKLLETIIRDHTMIKHKLIKHLVPKRKIMPNTSVMVFFRK